MGLAFGLTIAVALTTLLGALVTFFKRLEGLANPVTLATTLGFSAGLLVFISFVEVYGESVEAFGRGFQIIVGVNGSTDCGQLGLEFMNKTEQGQNCLLCDPTCEGYAWTAASAAFLLGVLIVFVMDYIVDKISPDTDEELEVLNVNRVCGADLESIPPNEESHANTESLPVDVDATEDAKFAILMKSQLNRIGMLTALGLGISNIPEGVATYIGVLGGTRVGASLAIGIALQNIAEGIAIAGPVYFATGSRLKAFMWTFVAGIAEPVGAVMAWLLVGDGLDPYAEGVMFGIVAGLMVTLIFKEHLPMALRYRPEGNTVIYSVLCGMGIMNFSQALFAYAGQE